MRKIKLEPVLVFGSKADFAIIDITDKPHKKRGTITIDYAPADMREIAKDHPSLDQALAYYETRIYNLVRYYIISEWTCEEGLEEALAIIEEHIKKYYP